ncbi:mono-functional DNA-alkylating methyl methanesulfonate N-term-domain-containing protein [Thelonectria olida]|uniref:Mono-functional DNA-alkylating methyl methanesulfonate N-term-domain-containing protein n=1 Tax=Thelonectria olida TaxID=1576542 RepID=A0A9P9AWV2_9HYPO|nr:mono-functional DNA-alkylating methyl methanesulfonate N-term-domain-containing protein [Thelonectria olida]
MAFQSAVLRDGEWVMERVNLQDALKASTDPKLPPVAESPEVPDCGILSRTVIDSPYAHWIIPVRLRSEHHNDIAFVGDRYVQISQLREDGQLHEVIRKTDFDYRIRNAVAIGPPPQDDANIKPHSFIKTEDPDVLMQDDTNPSRTNRLQPLPPQILVLILQTGDIIFLFVRERADGSLEFVTSKYDNYRDLEFLGFHLAVDPSSRYMAAGSSEDVFIVYELKPLESLNALYIRDGSFNPIKSIRPRQTQGIIHKLEFLHPRPEDGDFNIALLLVVSRKEAGHPHPRLRNVVYDWELDDDLKSVFAEETTGNLAPNQDELPLLIIPLKFNGAFISISAQSTRIGIGIVGDNLRYEDLPVKAPDTNGARKPLWTAWARPYRLKDYFEKTDVIYLAREDGVINYVEIDESSYMPTVHNVGTIETGVSDPTAFTTAYDRVADLHPRSSMKQVGTIPNWSPVWDLATTGDYSSWTAERPNSDVASRRRPASKWLQRPDRIFCASGQGLGSALTELRWGLQARIGLEFDYSHLVRQSWMFPVDPHGEGGHYALFSLPHLSEVFHISGDLESADALTSESSPFDMSSRTICAVQNEQGTIVQITETSTTLVVPTQSSRHFHNDVFEQNGIVVGNAFCKDDLVVLSTYQHDMSAVHLLRIDQMHIARAGLWEVQGEVTCISMFTVSETTWVVMGAVVNASPCVLIYSLDGNLLIAKQLDGPNETESYNRLEALTSISVLTEGVDGIVLVLGARSGHIVTARVSRHDSEWNFAVERLGTGPANVFSVPNFGGEVAVFACSDNTLSILTDFSPRHNKFKLRNTIWPTDLQDPSLPPPPIRSVFCLDQSLYGYHGHVSLLMLAGSRILLADIRPHFGPVPRRISLQGTPSRVLYSKTWKCLIVAHLQNDRPTLSFIDPDSGVTISRACHRGDDKPLDYISGLGVPNTTVRALCEWLYVKDGKTFPFIIVGTNYEVLIVSVNAVEAAGEDGTSRQLRYYTRYKRKGYGESIITSVVGCAEGLLICAGNVLHWEVLDVVEKKLKPRKQFRLDSEVMSLEVADGKAFVLTAKHSLQVIDLFVESGTTDMALIHSDQVTRRAYHQIGLGDSVEPAGKWPIHLVSTVQGGITGLWVPWNQRNKDLQVVFDAHLPTAIRRFRRGRTRPVGFSLNRKRRYDNLSTTVDGAEVFGVGLHGSLYHFSLIGPDLWRFLCLVQTLAHMSGEVCPLRRGSRLLGHDSLDMVVELEPRRSRSNMHVNGDVLRRCVDRRALRTLLRVPDAIDLFCEYLDGIEDGAYTEGFREDADEGQERYMELGYDILEYVLAPVL